MPEYPSKSQPDYYQILEITIPPAQVTPEIVNRQFRKISKKTHPDLLAGKLHKQPTQEETDKSKKAFQLLNEAREILGNPNKKRVYDSKRDMMRTKETEEDKALRAYMQKLLDEMIINGGTLSFNEELNEISLEDLMLVQKNLRQYERKLMYSHGDVIAEFSRCIEEKGKYRTDFWKVFKAATTHNYRGIDAVACLIAKLDWEKYQQAFPVSRSFTLKFNRVLKDFEDEIQEYSARFSRVVLNYLGSHLEQEF